MPPIVPPLPEELKAFQKRVSELQHEYFADDIVPPPDAHLWSQRDLRAFFESGGEERPPVAPDHFMWAHSHMEEQAEGARTSREEEQAATCASTVEDPTAGMVLRPAGQKRFRTIQPQVFVTSKRVRLVYQLAIGPKTPLIFLGGGMTGRIEACEQFGAESESWAQHTCLIFDRRNTGASDVSYDGAGAGMGGSSNVPENYMQRDDVIELILHLQLAPCIFIGFSSGARLFALVAFARPDLVKAIALLILTGGPLASATLGEQYYLQYAKRAREGGMSAVLDTPFYSERAALNARSRQALLAMHPDEFVAAMGASAALYTRTQQEPAIALPAEALRALGAVSRTPAFACNFFGEGQSDGMHTAKVTRAVAECIPSCAPAVVSKKLAVWFGSLVQFVAEHSTTTAPSSSTTPIFTQQSVELI